MRVDEVDNQPILPRVYRVVYHNFGPEVGAVFDKIQVGWVCLIPGFVCGRIEQQQQGKCVRPLDHWAIGIRRYADVRLEDVFDGRECFKASQQLSTVGGCGIGGHPEENVVYEHGSVQ